MRAQKTALNTLLAMAALALAVPTLASAEGSKIAVVDVQKAIQSIPDGKRAKNKLESDAKKKQKDLDKQQNALKKMKDDLERQAQLLQESVRRQKARDYQNKLMALQEAYMQHQKELKEKEAKLLKPIFDKLTKTIGTIAKERKFDLVVEKNAGVLYSSDALDITDDVIKRYGK